MGRRGCRTSGKAGILSGGASTLHGSATAGKGHGGGATQRIVRGGGGKRRFPHESEDGERVRFNRVIGDRGCSGN